MNIKFNTAQFDYSAKEKIFVAEASELRLERFPQIFMLVSERTGNEIAVTYNSTDYDIEGKTIGIRYRPVKGSEAGDFEVLIIND